MNSQLSHIMATRVYRCTDAAKVFFTLLHIYMQGNHECNLSSCSFLKHPFTVLLHWLVITLDYAHWALNGCVATQSNQDHNLASFPGSCGAGNEARPLQY